MVRAGHGNFQNFPKFPILWTPKFMLDRVFYTSSQYIDDDNNGPLSQFLLLSIYIYIFTNTCIRYFNMAFFSREIVYQPFKKNKLIKTYMYDEYAPIVIFFIYYYSITNLSITNTTCYM